MIGTFGVRVELADVITVDEVVAELATDPDHRLRRFNHRLQVNTSGRVEVDLVVDGPDVWTVALTAMSLFAEMSVSLNALHVEPPERDERRAA